jgi:hypothetical protein
MIFFPQVRISHILRFRSICDLFTDSRSYLINGLDQIYCAFCYRVTRYIKTRIGFNLHMLQRPIINVYFMSCEAL